MKKVLSTFGVALVLLAVVLSDQPVFLSGSVPAAAAAKRTPPILQTPAASQTPAVSPPVALTPLPTITSPLPEPSFACTPAPSHTAAPAQSAAVTPAPTAAPKPSPRPSAQEKATKLKTAYLTFDDGPVLKGKRPTNGTANLLKILKKHHIKATFFLIGRNVQAYPALARQIVKDGHVIGNHTWSHVDARKVKGSAFAWQVRHTNAVIYQVTGVRPKLFRPPYGSVLDGSQRWAIKSNGLTVRRWNVDTRDWAGTSDEKILRSVMNGIRKDKDLVILFHDHSYSPRALEETIALLQGNGYVFDTLDHMK